MKIMLIKIESVLFCIGLIVTIGFGSIWVLRDDIPVAIKGWSILLSVMILALLLTIGLITNQAIKEVNKKVENG